MGYRIMQLRNEMMKENVIIEEGILLKRPFYVESFEFATITSMYKPHDSDLKVTLVHEYYAKALGDGFKSLELYIPAETKGENEEGILLVIPYSKSIQFDTNVQRLAGRYPWEGIFLLKPNGIISVKNGRSIERFVALPFENKMYLVKLHED